MNRVVLDIEADGLDPTQIWCIVCYDIDKAEYRQFILPSKAKVLSSFTAYCKKVDVFIGHNLIDYDIPAIEKLLGKDIIPREKVVDTLVLSWLDDYQRYGGHSLDMWGQFLQHPKSEFNDFSHPLSHENFGLS